MTKSWLWKAVALVVFIGISQLAGLLGSIVTSPAIGTWYASLAKPFFTPPSWAFAPVWITLYALMGIALWLVWRKQPSRQPYVLFAIQLALNALWSFLFFGLQSPILGLAEIAILWIVIALTLRSFYKVSRPAGLLLLPYIAWVTIALALNLSIFLLNA